MKTVRIHELNDETNDDKYFIHWNVTKCGGVAAYVDGAKNSFIFGGNRTHQEP